MIKINNNEVSSVYDKTTGIEKIMKGVLLVYEGWKTLISSGVPPLTLLKSGGKNLVDYKLYGNSVQSKLPSEYQQVAYIESTGKQYIDTGYVVQEDDELELTYKLTDLTVSTDKVLIGANREETNGLWVETYSSDNRWYVRFGSNTSAYSYSDSTQYEGTLTIKKGEFIINGKKILSPTFDKMPVTTLNIFGAKVVMNSDYVYGSYAQISNFKITRNSKTIREFIPCYRKSDNVIGMYELIEGKFYTNNGTGTFLKGSNAPSLEAPIEIESMGYKKNIIECYGFSADGIYNPNNQRRLSNNYGTTISTIDFENSVTVTQSKIGDATNINNYSNGFFCIGLANEEGEYILSFDIDIKDNPLNTTSIFVMSQGGAATIDNQTIILPSGATGRVSFKFKYMYSTDERYSARRFLEFRIKGMSFTMSNIMLTKIGETIDYEPVGYKIPVEVSGKNLYDAKTYPLTDAWWISGVTGSGVNEVGFSATLDYIPCMHLRNKTITTSVYDKTVGNPGLAFYDKDKKLILGVKNNSSTKITTVVPNDAVYLRFCVNSNYKDKAMIELGEQVTNYEPYKEPTTTNIYLNEPLRKIGDYADYIDFKNKKVVRKIYTQEIKSTWVWDNYGTSFANTNNFRYKGIGKFTLISNYGKSDELKFGFSNANFNRVAINYSWFGLENGDLDGGKAKLAEMEASGNPFTVYYPSNGIPEEPIELPNIPTIKGTTILEVDTTIQPSNLEVVYKGKDKTEVKIEMLKEEDNLILNSILGTDTETELDITNDEIIEILDEIIGG